MKTLLHKTRLILGIIILAPCSAPLSQAQIIANFTNGNGTSSVDQYQGTAGSGWVGGWTTNSSGSGGTSGSPTIAPTVINTTPLNGGGNYLSSAVTTPSGDRTQWNAAVGRQYTAFGGVDPSQNHTVKFDFRLDSTSGFADAGDFVGAFGGASSSSNFVSSSTWAIRATAAATGSGGSIPAFTWSAYNGGKNGGPFSGSSLTQIGTGLTLVSGTVYTITVDLFPATLSYNVSVTDGVTSVSQTGLGFRASSSSATPFVSFGTQFATTSGTLTDTATFSVDSVSVIPEPSTFAMLGIGLVGLALLHRKSLRHPRRA